MSARGIPGRRRDQKRTGRTRWRSNMSARCARSAGVTAALRERSIEQAEHRDGAGARWRGALGRVAVARGQILGDRLRPPLAPFGGEAPVREQEAQAPAEAPLAEELVREPEHPQAALVIFR